MPERRHTVLIVDDEPDILQSLQLSLELDYDVLTATGGAEGLDLLARHGAALIISDQRMPQMTGVEFLERSLTVSPHSVRMMLTGFADLDAIIGAINAGRIYRYITKPWEPRDLEIDVLRGVEAYEMRVSLDRRMQELSTLCEIGTVITSVLDLDQVIQRILDGIVQTLGFERSILMLVDEDARMLRYRGCAGVTPEVLPFVSRLEYGLDREDVAVVLTVMQNRSILVENVNVPPVSADKEVMRRISIQSFVTAPLSVGNKGIGVLVAERMSTGDRVEEHDRRLLAGFAAQAAIAIENARLYGEALEKQRLEKEMVVAARIQQHLLPARWPPVERFDIAATSQPSRGVGGDYYDVLKDRSGQTWVALGDVSGKGVPAALTMATLRALFRAELEREQSLADVVRRIGDGLEHCTPPEVFATFCCGVLDPSAQTFTFVNAGHPGPLLVRADGSCSAVKGAGPPLGLAPLLTGELAYQEQRVDVHPGDLLVLYSDGVTEAMNAAGDLFEEDRLEAVVGHRRDGAAAVLEAITNAVAEFQGEAPQYDDVTLVVIKAVTSDENMMGSAVIVEVSGKK